MARYVSIPKEREMDILRRVASEIGFSALVIFVAQTALADSEPPALLGLQYISPAQQTGTLRRAEAAAGLYSNKYSDTYSDEDGSSKDDTKIGGPVLALGIATPVGSFRTGVVANRTQYKIEPSEDTGEDLTSDITTIITTPFVAVDLGNGLAVGADYAYVATHYDFPSFEDDGTISRDESDLWGSRMRLAGQKKIDATTVGFAYISKMRRIPLLPVSFLLYGRHDVGASSSFGLALTYRMNGAASDDLGYEPEETLDNSIDVAADASFKFGGSNELNLLVAYLPRSHEPQLPGTILGDVDAWSTRVATEVVFGLTSSLDVGLVLEYLKYGSDETDDKQEGSATRPQIRLAANF
jgi:hypothetical protein